jgi:hypothetical protein
LGYLEYQNDALRYQALFYDSLSINELIEIYTHLRSKNEALTLGDIEYEVNLVYPYHILG